jgi:signal transduction histidine kinase
VIAQVLYDITQLLDSADDFEARVTRALEHLRLLVPYERCAVLDAPPNGEPRLLAANGTSARDQAELGATTRALLRRLALAEVPAEPTSELARVHLAVPLVGLDQVVGVLFVDRAAEAYDDEQLRTLSVVAAKLAAYFSMLHAFQREAERALELERAQRATEAASRAKDEFLALVSHELRTPLNSILTWADALRSNATPEAARVRAVEAIERAVSAQAKLIADLLDLACIAAATLRLDLSAVNPASLIKDVISKLQPQAQQKAIRLDVTLDESLAPLVADRRRLSQVVVSLVANAIKFTPVGGQVEVRLEREGLLARIRVIDTGPGIGPEALPRLFEPFVHGEGLTTRVQGGLGVGLALVKDLVQLHGGQVRAESLGDRRGATFTVELPLAGAVSDRPSPVPPEIDGSRALAGVHVLVVDDDRDIGEVLQFILESRGARVSMARSSAEALASVTRTMPDVLLSDLAMPGESGYDLMRRLVEREGSRAPPAAALSANPRGRDQQEARAVGFRMLLEKPIESETLVKAVATLASEGIAQTGRRLQTAKDAS